MATTESSPLQIYKASAGSGKTYQLALKYITLLLGEFDEHGRYRLAPPLTLNRHREILAITFTNKATQEMKQRIIKELRLLADAGSKSGYRAEIHRLVAPDDTDMQDADVDARIRVAANNALTAMLFTLGDMNVSTIDSFFQRVLRSFAYEADLSGNYDLMLENKLMTDMAIDNMLALACGMGGVVAPKELDAAYLKERVKNLIVDCAEGEKQYRVFSSDSGLRKSLIKFINDLSGEEYIARKEAIAAFLSKPGAIAGLTAGLKKERTRLISSIAADVCRMQNIGGLVFSSNATTFMTRWIHGETELFADTNLAIISGERDITSLLNKGSDPASIVMLQQVAVRPIELTRSLMSVNLMLQQMNFMGLFREILTVERNLKIRTNTIMLSDTNELLNRIIDDSCTPFIYERIGQRLRHFLIDEFQDTSQMQWNNIVPLLTESMGTGRQNLVIGDVKQCIYRFRNSDPRLLQNLEHDPKLGAQAEDIASIAMDTNWRSSKVVVDFNNELFSRVATSTGVDPAKLRAYSRQGVSQKAHKANLPGYVDIQLAADTKATGYVRMAENIRRQLDCGYPPSEIVVLVRDNTEARNAVEFLMEQSMAGGMLEGVAVLSDEALYVSASPAVQWIAGKLRQLDTLTPNTPKRLNRKGMPVAHASDIDRMQEILASLNAEGSATAVEEMIKQFNSLRCDPDADRDLEKELSALANGLSLQELVEELVRHLPDASLRRRDAQYISAFQDLVFDYCGSKSPTLHGFIDLWDKKLSATAAVGLAEGTEAVRVMTIHKSKGLEFGAVHLPEVKDPLDKMKGHIWFSTKALFDALGWAEGTYPEYFPLEKTKSANLQATAFSAEYREAVDNTVVDEINALYVAFTRAKQELIVTVKDSRSKTSKKANAFAKNSPASLLVPILNAMTQKSESTEWTFGKPTEECEVKNEHSDVKTVVFDEYTVEPRCDIWSQTKVANADDSDNPL